MVDAGELTLESFERDYLSRRRPVLIRGGAASWVHAPGAPPPPPGAFRWSKKQLAKLLKKVPLSMGPVPYAETYGSQQGDFSPMEEYLSQLEAFDARLAKGAASQTPPEGEERGSVAAETARLRAASDALPPYVFDGQIGMKLPDFDALFDPPPPFFGDYARVLTQLSLGPALSGAPPHFHGDTWNALLYGSKRWFLFEPAEAFFARPQLRAIDWALEASDAATVGGKRPMGRQCMQAAGDILYVPRLWGHAVLNVQESVGFAIEFEQQ